MDSITTFRGIKIFSLFTFAFLLGECMASRGTISVPMNPDMGALRVSKKIPATVGLFISQENKYYSYKGTPPPGSEFSGLEHSFPLGKALEKISMQRFSQYYREVKLVSPPLEAKDFKIIIEPQIEEFAFRYDYITKGSGSSTFEYVVSTVTLKVNVTFYGDGKRIWNRSLKASSAPKEILMSGRNFDYKEAIGEAASQALVDSVSRIAEELSVAPEVEDYLADIAPTIPNRRG